MFKHISVPEEGSKIYFDNENNRDVFFMQINFKNKRYKRFYGMTD